MDTRPIGVFDSGLGGLTAVRELRQLLPSENIIYFGDTARVPYGGRSAEILLKYARQDVRFLRSHDIKAILVACGTVSTTALPQLRQESDIPILGGGACMPPGGGCDPEPAGGSHRHRRLRPQRRLPAQSAPAGPGHRRNG